MDYKPPTKWDSMYFTSPWDGATFGALFFPDAAWVPGGFLWPGRC